MTLAEIKAAAKESLSHTWSGGEIPIGPSIPGAYQNAVRAEKANARNVLWLVERVEEMAECFRPEPYTGVRNPLCVSCKGNTMVNGKNHDDPRWLPCSRCGGTGLAEHLRAALARLEGK